MLLAGSETTATTLSGATYFLLSHPHILERLKQEIRTAFSSPDEINIGSVGKLSYMLAVLNETLRCYPPLTAGMVRVVPPEGAHIAGHYVPQGVSVSSFHNIYVTVPGKVLIPRTSFLDSCRSSALVSEPQQGQLAGSLGLPPRTLHGRCKRGSCERR